MTVRTLGLHLLLSILTRFADCCLDVEWLSEDGFATAGSDARIQVMQIGRNTPVKTLRYVLERPCGAI